MVWDSGSSLIVTQSVGAVVASEDTGGVGVFLKDEETGGVDVAPNATGGVGVLRVEEVVCESDLWSTFDTAGGTFVVFVALLDACKENESQR